MMCFYDTQTRSLSQSSRSPLVCNRETSVHQTTEDSVPLKTNEENNAFSRNFDAQSALNSVTSCAQWGSQSHLSATHVRHVELILVFFAFHQFHTPMTPLTSQILANGNWHVSQKQPGRKVLKRWQTSSAARDNLRTIGEPHTEKHVHVHETHRIKLERPTARIPSCMCFFFFSSILFPSWNLSAVSSSPTTFSVTISSSSSPSSLSFLL